MIDLHRPLTSLILTILNQWQIPHRLFSPSFLFVLLARLLLLVKMQLLGAFVALIQLLGVTRALAGLPRSGNSLWYSKPGTLWSRELLPVGNGYQAAMIPGCTMQEATQLDIESLWTGGPFADQAYNGGNKLPREQTAMAKAMESIRQTIFQNPTGDIDTSLFPSSALLFVIYSHQTPGHGSWAIRVVCWCWVSSLQYK